MNAARQLHAYLRCEDLDREEPSLQYFLGRRESLEETVEADQKRLAELGVTTKEIAEKMSYLMGSGIAVNGVSSISHTKRVSGDFAIDQTTYICGSPNWGKQICPWQRLAENVGAEEAASNGYGESCSRPGFGWEYFRIEYVLTHDSVNFFGILPHIIAAHSFFGGKESKMVCYGNERPIRVDPQKLIRALNIAYQEQAYIDNELGINLKASVGIAESVRKFPHLITLVKNNMVVNAKSSLELLTLGATKGTVITISISKDFPVWEEAAKIVKQAVSATYL